MKIIETYIVNWRELQFGEEVFQLCKVHICASNIGYLNERKSYIREYETGKGIKLQTISKEEFFQQLKNSI